MESMDTQRLQSGLRLVARGQEEVAAALGEHDPASEDERTARVIQEWGLPRAHPEGVLGASQRHGFALQITEGWTRGDWVEIGDDGLRYLTGKSHRWLEARRRASPYAATRSTRRATSTTQYGDHARWELLRAAGIGTDDLRSGVGPVTLENTIRYLRAGDEVDVTCAFEWSEGRTFRVRQEFPRPAGELAAELTGVGGLLDLRARRLVDDPKARRRPHPSCWVSDRRPRTRATMARLGMWTTRSSRFAASRSSSKAFPCCET